MGYILAAALIGVGAAECGDSDDDGVSDVEEYFDNIGEQIDEADTQGYMLLYKEAGTSIVRGQWSDDGTAWNNIDLQPTVTNSGPGAASDHLGLLRILAIPDSNGRIELTWGLGAIFDDSGHDATTQVAHSAPSAAEGKGSQFIVAYRLAGDHLAIRVYDTDQRKFADRNYAPIDGIDPLSGRPALVRLGERIVLAWNSGGELRFAAGSVESDGIPVFPELSDFVPPTTGVAGSCYTGYASDPSLTHDHDRFYLGYTMATTRCPDYEGDFLSRTDALLHSSTDGVSWGAPIATAAQLPPDSVVNIAGRADSTILVIAVGSNGNEDVRRLDVDSNSWTTIDNVFNWTPSISPTPQQFSLIATGRPPTA